MHVQVQAHSVWANILTGHFHVMQRLTGQSQCDKFPLASLVAVPLTVSKKFVVILAI